MASTKSDGEKTTTKRTSKTSKTANTKTTNKSSGSKSASNKTTTKRTTSAAKTPSAANKIAKETDAKKIDRPVFRGRPKKVDPNELANAAILYAQTAYIPIIAEFAHLNGITREYLYELANNESAKGNDDLSYAIKWMSEAKEIVLEKGTLSGEFNSTMGIFSLKQQGWKDKQEQEVSISADDEQTSGVILLAPVMERESSE